MPRPLPFLVLLDAAHGGTDSGARGETGVVEKEVVMSLAQGLRRDLERQGLRVLLTRQGDVLSSFDDRAALANGYSGGVFVSLHVSSLGRPGTAIVYSLPLPAKAGAPGAPPERRDLSAPIRWEEAQVAFLAESRQLAELLQIQLALRFPGSPEVPAAGLVRQLRLVAHPAVAIELSSVAVEDARPLEKMEPGLAEAVGKAVAAFRQAGEAGKP